MPHQPLVSIIITSYNYERYVRETIDSALAQTYPHTEVIVVDDGSTDGSRDVIAAYGEAVRPIFKANGGQTSSANAGFAASRGELVMFLDSDDVLLPDTIARVVAAFRPGVSKVQFRLTVVDAEGRPTGDHLPPLAYRLPNGNEQATVLKGQCYPSPPTSGNVYTRQVLVRLMPIPTDVWVTSIDTYQLNLAALFGTIASLDEPGGLYRVHGENLWAGGLKAFDGDQLERYVKQVMVRTELITEWAEREGLARGPHPAFQYPGEMARLMALKLLAPDHRLVKEHATWWLAWRGITAIAGDRYPPGLLRRVAGAGWYLATALLPRSLAIAVAERTLFRRPARRPLAPAQAS
jgi:glycosyltransferase involved in cell wall biosynthesis